MIFLKLYISSETALPQNNVGHNISK